MALAFSHPETAGRRPAFELLGLSSVSSFYRLCADQGGQALGYVHAMVIQRGRFMSSRLLASCLVCLGLTACAGRVDRGNALAYAARNTQLVPVTETYVWARNDGRRMSGNPALLRQGQKDQAYCRDEATKGRTHHHNIFAQCMQRRGYLARLAS